MNKLFLFFVFLSLTSFIISAQETPYTPEIITVRGSTIVPVNFFNTGEAGTYTAILKHGTSVARVQTNSVFVRREEFGSFNLEIAQNNPEKGVYFDSLVISKGGKIFQEIPLIIGVESRASEIEYDTSINFEPKLDISIISGEKVISPTIDIYKLNYNNPGSNGVVLGLSVYSINGELLKYSEETLSVSRQASFERFINLGANPPNEVLIVASVKSGESVGLDVSQISLLNSPSLSPPLEEKDYSSRIYLGVFLFLLSSIILVSYLWRNKYNEQAKNWRSELDYIKKTQFSDASKGLRKLQAQRGVLERAYSNHYISKISFDSAIAEISKLSGQLKKRL